MPIADADLALLKRAALHYKHQLALQQERLHSLNTDPDHAAVIDARAAEVESHLSSPALATVNPCRRPTLTPDHSPGRLEGAQRIEMGRRGC
jgi:hypothetical protein